MKILSLVTLSCMLFAVTAAAQHNEPGTSQWYPRAVSAPMALAFASAGSQKNDAAYKLYKEGYQLILDQRWDAALQKLSEVGTKYPKSDYVIDAAYWKAAALRHIDAKKAKDAYKNFIRDYPKSRYYDDALSDYLELTHGNANGLNHLTVKQGGQVYVNDDGRVHVQRGNVHVEKNGVVVSAEDDSGSLSFTPFVVGTGKGSSSSSRSSYGYGYGFGPQFGPDLHRSMRDLKRSLRLMNLNMLPGHLVAPRALRPVEEEKLDPETSLKMEALYALGETKEDDKSFGTLKTVALDRTQPRPLREAALETLSGFKKYDVFPIYLEIARHDTNPDLQNSAIDYISEQTKDKNKSLSTLIDLFNSLPRDRSQQRETIFYSIAEIGNDKAVDFLTTIALTNSDYELRRQAVYYLGSIGGERARSALYEVLKSGK